MRMAKGQNVTVGSDQQMPIRLPAIEDPRCVLFIACAEIESRSTKVKALLKSNQQLHNRLKMGGHPYHFAATLGDREGGHFHIDFAALEYFKKKDFPKQTHTLDEIQEAIEPLVGQKATVRMEGRFEVQVTDLPGTVREFLKTMSTPTTIGGVKIRTTAGTLVVEGTPISTIKWWLRRDGEVILLELEGRTKVTISDSYLEELWQSVETTFGRLVPQESSNGSD
jgi:hypothetical protein